MYTVSMIPQLYHVSWKEFMVGCDTLGSTLASHHLDCIVAISRGGLVVGRVLSDILEVPLLVVSTQSYEGFAQAHKPVVRSFLSPDDIEGKRVALVDDIADTGDTVRVVVDHLKAYNPQEVVTAVQYQKSHNTYAVDYVLHTTDKWVVFPYERVKN